MSAHNQRMDKFDFHQESYWMTLKNVKLSSSLTDNFVNNQTMISQGYICFLNAPGMVYHFSPLLIHCWYIGNNTFFIKVPISYIQEWLIKDFIGVMDNKYVLKHDFLVSGGIECSSPINDKVIQMIEER